MKEKKYKEKDESKSSYWFPTFLQSLMIEPKRIMVDSTGSQKFEVPSVTFRHISSDENERRQFPIIIQT